MYINNHAKLQKWPITKKEVSNQLCIRWLLIGDTGNVNLCMLDQVHRIANKNHQLTTCTADCAVTNWPWYVYSWLYNAHLVTHTADCVLIKWQCVQLYSQLYAQWSTAHFDSRLKTDQLTVYTAVCKLINRPRIQLIVQLPYPVPVHCQAGSCSPLSSVPLTEPLCHPPPFVTCSSVHIYSF